jgi:prevent-host-death family protein
MSRKRAAAIPIGAAAFKAKCLELMDRVRETREEFVVTKHGRPVAKLVPYDPPGRTGAFWGSMKGTVLRYDRPFDPVDGAWFSEPGPWRSPARAPRTARTPRKQT